MTTTTRAIGAKEGKAKARPISRTSKLAAKVAKRPKTGGRTRPTIERRLELAIQRSEIAKLDDDTTLDSELAALYLGISEKKLEELRRPPRRSDFFIAPRLTFLKIFDHGATGRNQPVMYKLGDLRAYQLCLRATDTHESAANAGMAGWMVKRHPFYTKTIQGVGDVVVADAWDPYLSSRDELFLALLQRTVKLKWMSPANAALELWQDRQAHQRLVSIGHWHWENVHHAITSALARTRVVPAVD